MKELWRFIEEASADVGYLPLVHSTNYYRFRRIISDGNLRVGPCPVYKGEQLAYFFYGRPAYRVHSKEKTLGAKSFEPVCLIFGNKMQDRAIRIMPFDSGAFNEKMTHPPMHYDMQLSEFELEINASAPMKLVKMFFETERDYIDSRPRFFDYDPYSNLHVDSYYRLIRVGDNRDVDDRVSAIELQFDRDTPLAHNVEAVILPAPSMDAEGIVQQIESWGAIAIPYDIQESFRPSELYGAILNRLKDYYRQKGIL